MGCGTAGHLSPKAAHADTASSTKSTKRFVAERVCWSQALGRRMAESRHTEQGFGLLSHPVGRAFCSDTLLKWQVILYREQLWVRAGTVSVRAQGKALIDHCVY